MKVLPLAAVITIGQSPRPDMTEELNTLLDGRVGLLELGALDGLSREAIAGLAPLPGESPLITRLADGSPVTVSEQRLAPLLLEKLREGRAAGANISALLCTGSFPLLEKEPDVLTLDRVFHRRQTLPEDAHSLGLLVPLESQRAVFERQFAPFGRKVLSRAASPYGDQEALERAAIELRTEGAGCLLLDCMGYTAAQGARLAALTGAEVRLPRTELAKELLRRLCPQWE